jgi:hypothetical protein
MGTAVAPDTANVFMAVCADLRGVYGAARLASTLAQGTKLLLFARLIDDYTDVLSSCPPLQAGCDLLHCTAVTALRQALTLRTAPHLTVTWKASRICTLDLHVYTAPNFALTRRLSFFRTHQRPGNRYEFLPYTTRYAPGSVEGY